MQNRITCLILALCLTFSLAVPVGAANIAGTENEADSLDLKTGTSIALQKISTRQIFSSDAKCSTNPKPVWASSPSEKPL